MQEIPNQSWGDTIHLPPTLNIDCHQSVPAGRDCDEGDDDIMGPDWQDVELLSSKKDSTLTLNYHPIESKPIS